jgi:hypothetical protein
MRSFEYIEGYRAYFDGTLSLDNPYASGSYNAIEWDNGWHSADRGEDVDE